MACSGGGWSRSTDPLRRSQHISNRHQSVQLPVVFLKQTTVVLRESGKTIAVMILRKNCQFQLLRSTADPQQIHSPYSPRPCRNLGRRARSEVIFGLSPAFSAAGILRDPDHGVHEMKRDRRRMQIESKGSSIRIVPKRICRLCSLFKFNLMTRKKWKKNVRAAKLVLRILGWKAFHQQLMVVLQAFSNRSMSTSEFLEKMNEMEAVEADGRDLKARKHMSKHMSRLSNCCMEARWDDVMLK